MVCPECGHVSGPDGPAAARGALQERRCPAGNCGEADLRMRIMLYDDGEGVTSPPVLDIGSRGLSLPSPVTAELP